MSRCTRCLAPVETPDFLERDHLCDECFQAPETYPHKTNDAACAYSPLDAKRSEE